MPIKLAVQSRILARPASSCFHHLLPKLFERECPLGEAPDHHDYGSGYDAAYPLDPEANKVEGFVQRNPGHAPERELIRSQR
jgi:hypothetical protein